MFKGVPECFPFPFSFLYLLYAVALQDRLSQSNTPVLILHFHVSRTISELNFFCFCKLASVRYSVTETENGSRHLVSLKIASCICLGIQKEVNLIKFPQNTQLCISKLLFSLALIWWIPNFPFVLNAPPPSLIISRAFHSGKSSLWPPRPTFER